MTKNTNNLVDNLLAIKKNRRNKIQIFNITILSMSFFAIYEKIYTVIFYPEYFDKLLYMCSQCLMPAVFVWLTVIWTSYSNIHFMPTNNLLLKQWYRNRCICKFACEIMSIIAFIVCILYCSHIVIENIPLGSKEITVMIGIIILIFMDFLYYTSNNKILYRYHKGLYHKANYPGAKFKDNYGNDFIYVI